MINRTGTTAIIAAAFLPIAAALAAQTTPPSPPADATATAAPVATPTPDPATPPAAAQEPAAAPTTPFDTLLTSAKPYASDPKSAAYKVVSATTKDCVTQLSLEGGSKLSIDLKVMQGLTVNTNLMIRGGGHSVQLEFDGKNGAKAASDAEKALDDLNNKCG